MFSFLLAVQLLISQVPITHGEEIHLNEKPFQPYISKDGVIRANISVEKDLPAEFYGAWSVTSTLIETNNPKKFRTKSSDIWVFKRQDNLITLANPVTGASATITVQEVQNKTATFVRVEKDTQGIHELEKAIITVDGDTFSGTDELIINFLQNKETYNSDIVKYQLRGHKISGPTMKEIFSY